MWHQRRGWSFAATWRLLTSNRLRLRVDHDVADCREASTNPFNIPADEDIFRHREEDKRLKSEARIAALQQSVSAKTTFASRMQATTTEEAKQLIRQLRYVPGTQQQQGMQQDL
jgi:hypothetical protein